MNSEEKRVLAGLLSGENFSNRHPQEALKWLENNVFANPSHGAAPADKILPEMVALFPDHTWIECPEHAGLTDGEIYYRHDIDAPAGPEGAEAVRWETLKPGGKHWGFHQTEQSALIDTEVTSNLTIRPLYAHPAKAAPGITRDPVDLVEAAQKVIDILDEHNGDTDPFSDPEEDWAQEHPLFYAEYILCKALKSAFTTQVERAAITREDIEGLRSIGPRIIGEPSDEFENGFDAALDAFIALLPEDA